MEMTTSEQFGSYNWPLTVAGNTSQLTCVLKEGHSASRTCSEDGTWIAVNYVDCRICKLVTGNIQTPDFCAYNKLMVFIFTVPPSSRNQTLYIRFSSSASGIFNRSSIQVALQSVENVVCNIELHMCVIRIACMV